MQVAFDRVYFREILLRDKRFLFDLYKNNKLQNEKQIIATEEYHLNTLIKIFHLILNNAIPILEESVVKIKNAKNCHFLNNILNHMKIFLKF